MAVIGKTELQADKDIMANTETRLLDLFSFDERSKQFVVEQPVKRDETKVKVNVAKVGSLEGMSDATLPKGFNTSLELLMKWADLSKKITVAQPVKKGETLAVTVEV